MAYQLGQTETDQKINWTNVAQQTQQIAAQVQQQATSKHAQAAALAAQHGAGWATAGSVLPVWGTVAAGLIGAGYGAYKAYSVQDPTTHAPPEAYAVEPTVRQGVISSEQLALALRRQPESGAAKMRPVGELPQGTPVKWSKLGRSTNWAFVQDPASGASGFSVWRSNAGAIRIIDTTPAPMLPAREGFFKFDVGSLPSWVWLTAVGAIGVTGVVLAMRK